jgi:hypothetical protein
MKHLKIIAKRSPVEFALLILGIAVILVSLINSK